MLERFELTWHGTVKIDAGGGPVWAGAEGYWWWSARSDCERLPGLCLAAGAASPNSASRRQAQARLRALREQNEKLRRLAALGESPAALEKSVKDLNLGLVPAQHGQVWILTEPAAENPAAPGAPQYAAGPVREPAGP